MNDIHKLAVLCRTPDDAAADARGERMAEATAIIEEFMRIVARAKREGSYVYETAAYGRVMQRARKFLEGTGDDGVATD